jgi:multiple sugar transport system permease protein
MRVGWYSTGAALSILFLFPLLWGGYESFQGQAGSGQETGFGFGNYTAMAEYGEGIATYLRNTAAVSLMTVVGTLVVSALGGYAFARFRFPGKEILFLATLAILMVPYATILIPLYVVLGELGLQNSLVGLSLVLIMFQLPFAIFMMRNSFEAVPRELEEAALVDGCTRFGAFVRVVIPNAAPGLLATFVYAFLFAWDELLFATALTEQDAETIPIGIRNFIGNYNEEYDQLMAAGVVSTIPVLIAFFATQRWLVKGLTAGAVKG